MRRDPIVVLALIFLTCGLYYLYFIYKVSEETQDFLGDIDVAPATEVLLSVITCGLWNIYWDYRMGKRMAEMCRRAGIVVTDNSSLYLILDLVGIGGFLSAGILNPLLQQDTLNRIWKAGEQGEWQGQSGTGTWPPPPAAPSSAPYAAPSDPSSHPSSHPSAGPRQPRPPRP